MTKLGVLSDSHGHEKTTRRAVRLLLDAGAETLVHLGDIGTEAVIDELAGHNARIVFGNCDGNYRELASYAGHVGVTVDHPVGRFVVDGRLVVFTHGHLPTPMKEAIGEDAAYLLHGHTHEVRDDRVGGTRVINPGALFRAARYTAAVLDAETDALEFIEVPKDL